MKNIYIPCPPKAEQELLGAYLQDTCEKIDANITQTQKMIDQLTAYKQSLITETVTHGLHPEVPLRDSGVEWIGEIPETWQVGQLKFFVGIKAGITLGKKYSPEELDRLVECPYLRVANVQDGHLDLQVVKTIRVLPEEMDTFALHEGELLMNEGGDRDKLARGCIWHNEIEKCLHQNHVFAVTTNDKLDTPYLAYLTASDVGRNYFDMTAKKTTNLASTNATTILGFIIPIPKLQEQQEIITFLDAKCTAIDADIAKRRALIEQLADYKRSMIYEVVTGKREVE